MIRRRQVFPDENGIVTREALVEASLAAIDMLDFAGGTISIVTQRAPTSLEGEMVTTAAVVEWRHAAHVSPRPEQFEPGARGAAPEPQPQPEPREVEREQSPVDDDPLLTRLGVDDDLPAEPDGFDMSKLEEEDIDDPVAAR